MHSGAGSAEDGPLANEQFAKLTCLPYCVQKLSPTTLLMVCILVSWLCREALTAADIVRAVLHGMLPYGDMPTHCKDILEAAGNIVPKGAIQPMRSLGWYFYADMLHHDTHPILYSHVVCAYSHCSVTLVWWVG